MKFHSPALKTFYIHGVWYWEFNYIENGVCYRTRPQLRKNLDKEKSVLELNGFTQATTKEWNRYRI